MVDRVDGWRVTAGGDALAAVPLAMALRALQEHGHLTTGDLRSIRPSLRGVELLGDVPVDRPAGVQVHEALTRVVGEASLASRCPPNLLACIPYSAQHGVLVSVIEGSARTTGWPWAMMLNELTQERQWNYLYDRLALNVSMAVDRMVRTLGLLARAEAMWARTPAEPALASVFAWVGERWRSVVRADQYHGDTARFRVRLIEDPPGVEVLLERTPMATLAWRPDGSSEIARSVYADATELEVLGSALVGDLGPALPAQLAALIAEPSWERELRFLDEVLATVPEEASTEGELGWRLKRLGEAPDDLRLEPVWLKAKPRGGVSAKKASYASIRRQGSALPIDEALVQLSSSTEPAWRALPLLVDHPRVVSPEGALLQLLRADPQVELVEVEGGAFRFGVTLGGQDIAAHIEDAGLWRRVWWALDGARLWVATPTPEVAARLVQIASRRVWVSAAGADALRERLARLVEAVPVALPEALRGPEVAADARPVVRLSGPPDAMTLSLLVRPAPERATFAPGEGPDRLPVQRAGQLVTVVRDLSGERTRAAALAAEVGVTLASAGPTPLPSVGAALVAVRSLAGRGDVVVEWDGRPTRVGRTARRGDVQLRLNPARDWFGLSGGLEVDGEGVDLADVLAAVEDGSGWLRVRDGLWVELEAPLVEALGVAARLGRDRRHGVRLHAVHGPVLAALAAEGLPVSAPPDWWSMSERITEAATMDVSLPDGLNAELRPYQVEGFRWLARLAHWSPGAVLADDMGLGKTLQAISLLLRRAASGPALVVAPVSVVDNWRAELLRFAPSLRVRVHQGAGRADRLGEPGPGEVVLTSYDLMVRDIEPLGGKNWATVVLDEAHHVKNPASLRAKAARGLTATFTLALTGTPVENHLGDLWSLFEATVPGLFGSIEEFRRHFAQRIAVGDLDARKALAALVRPFVLRRRKVEVARELPARTELIERVALSDVERALYERERVAAVAAIGQPQRGDEVQRRFQVLAALTRLRQLACHPALLDPNSPIPSSKLARVRELVADLRAEGHRILVFSQFVRHLQLVRDALEADGARCQWLDGSTPAPQRAAAIAAFQDGQGDVFLLSLKAGGTGINLTAASWVLHLDPWWNPAAEDQATDRAHRIGQDKPVTVVRLVSVGTIEEQVVRLHGEKRELAAAVLEGTDTARPASVEELVGLLAGDAVRSADEPAPTATALEHAEGGTVAEATGATRTPPLAAPPVRAPRAITFPGLADSPDAEPTTDAGRSADGPSAEDVALSPTAGEAAPAVITTPSSAPDPSPEPEGDNVVAPPDAGTSALPTASPLPPEVEAARLRVESILAGRVHQGRMTRTAEAGQLAALDALLARAGADLSRDHLVRVAKSALERRMALMLTEATR